MLTHKKTNVETLAENLGNEPIAGRSLWRDAMHRFSRNKAAMAGLVVLGLIVLFAAIGPFVAAWHYSDIDWSLMGNAATAGQPSIANGHYLFQRHPFPLRQLHQDFFLGVRINHFAAQIARHLPID